ncbi:MAG TPA: autotransporter-associated beta strand repeat-containing protein [Humisphaera sp.]
MMSLSDRSVTAFRALSLSAAVAAALAGLRPAAAAPYDWDVGPTANDGAVTGGAGTWDTTTPNFTANGGATNVVWPNTAADVARFGAPGGAVTVAAPVTAGGLVFSADGYTVQNNGTAANTLTLGAGSTIDVAAGVTATITASLVGGTDNTIYFTKTGDGSVVLNPLLNTATPAAATNTFAGDVRITSGAVVAQIGGAFAGGATANGTRIILDQDAGKTATVQINTGYDPAASPAASFDRYLFGGNGGTINVAGTATTQQQLLLNDANQFGDYTTATAATVFTKAGLGIVTLQSQAYAFSGSVVVAEGTLRVDGAGNLGAATNTNPVTVNSGGTFDLRATLSNAAKPVSIAGPGWNNTGALVNGGTAAVAVGPVTMTGSASVGGAGQLTLGSVSTTPANAAYDLTKVGAGLTVLATTNAYNGNTVVAGGVLRDTTGTSLPNASGALIGNLNLAGGAYERGGTFNLPLGTGPNQVQFTGPAGGLSANGAALAVNVGGAAAELVWGAAPFNPGTLILNATTANNAITLQNPLDLNAGTANVTRTISVGANTATVGTLIRDSSATNTAGLTKTGAGTLVLSNAANTYDGTTTISAGVLSVATLPDGATSPIGAGGVAFTTGGGSGTFQYTGATPITTNRTFTVGANNATIDVSNAAGGLEVTASVAGNNANTVTKAGAGTLTLSGTGDNGSFILNAAAGTTLLNKSGAATSRAVAGIANIAPGATVRLVGSGTDQIYGGNATATAGLVNLGGGTLDLNGKSESLDRLTGFGTVVNNGAAGTTSVVTLGEAGGTAGGFGGTIDDGAAGGKVAVVKVGAGTQVLGGGGTYSGGTTVNAGTVRAISPTAFGAGPVTLNGGTLSLAGTVISGFGGTGAGYTLNGGPTVAGDVVTLTTAAGSQARSIYNNNRVDVRAFTASFRYDNLTNGGGADGFTFILQNQGLTALGASGGARAISGITPSVAITFNIFNNDNTAVGVNGATAGTTSGQLPALDTVPTNLLDLADVSVAYDGTTLTFTVTNPNNTAQTITRSTTINLPALLGSNSAIVGFTGSTGGTNAGQTVTNFAYASTAAVSVPNAVTVAAAATAAVDVTNLSAGGVGPLAVGAGATLNVTNTGAAANAPYTLSATSVVLAAGSSVAVANHGTGAGTLATGGFAGVGSVTGAVRASGTIAPGAATGATGTLSVVGTLATGSGAVYAAETAAPGTSDVLALTGAGALDLSAADTLNVLPLVAVGSTPATYTIASFSSLTGTFDSVLVNGSPAQSANPAGANYVNVLYPTSAGGTAGLIQIQVANVSAVPEPGTVGVLAVAAAGLLARRRRRHG